MYSNTYITWNFYGTSSFQIQSHCFRFWTIYSPLYFRVSSGVVYVCMYVCEREARIWRHIYKARVRYGNSEVEKTISSLCFIDIGDLFPFDPLALAPNRLPPNEWWFQARSNNIKLTLTLATHQNEQQFRLISTIQLMAQKLFSVHTFLRIGILES